HRMSGAPLSMSRRFSSRFSRSFAACRRSVRGFARFALQGAAVAAIATAIAVLPPRPAAARGPENIADVAEQVIDAVVNVSTSQKVDPHVTEMPDLPPG